MDNKYPCKRCGGVAQLETELEDSFIKCSICGSVSKRILNNDRVAISEIEEAWMRSYHEEIGVLGDLIDDNSSLENIDIYESWNPDTSYIASNKRVFNEKLYKCLQGHNSQSGWEPPAVPALWVEISIDEWPLLPNPIPSTNPWMKDQKCRLVDGTRWISLINNNVWQPSEYSAGWKKVVILV